MKFKILACLIISLSACNNQQPKVNENDLLSLMNQYYEERLSLFPFEATANGDNRYNHLFPNDISESYRKQVKEFYNKYQLELNKVSSKDLNQEDAVNYEILKWELETGIESFNYKDHLRPVNQFYSTPLAFAQLGSGKSIQPFKNVKDYTDFLQRIDGFAVWCDTAVANMRTGIKEGITNPKALMLKTLPQLSSMLNKDYKESIFYQPIVNIPKEFSDDDKEKLADLYKAAITEKVIPSYQKLHDFIRDEYIPACRSTVGLGEIPGGSDHYRFLSKYYTTTDLTPDSIYNLGMSEVARIRVEMEKLMAETGFKGDLKSFFAFMNTDPQFFPFKTPQEVIDSFNNIHEAMKPQLSKLFNKTPRSKFEVRQTEKFRERTASAEYNQGTADGSRPGIFYTPIPDAAKYNTFAMEDLFLHEAIPGHHYQNMLTIENESLPLLRRYLWYGAYGEGWALYTESLGKELGLYTNPYQHFAALSAEMHRAIRLVVDVGMHLKGWTREEAIQFSLDNEGEGEESIVSEIERYMALPAQALSYKIGQLKISELRSEAEKQLGSAFDIRAFHDEVLKDGCLPLAVLEAKIDRWIERSKVQN